MKYEGVLTDANMHSLDFFQAPSEGGMKRPLFTNGGSYHKN